MTASGSPQSDTRSLVRSAVLVAAAMGALAAVVVIVWWASTALLVIFAGMLVAIALDAGASALKRLVGGPRRLHLGIVVLGVAALLLGAMAWGGTTVAQQLGEFVSVFDEQVGEIMESLRSRGITFGSEEDQFDFRNILPDLRALAGGATNAIFSFFGIAGSVLIVLFLGVFFAAEPATYKAGILNLIPLHRRARISDVLDRSARALRSWMFGQAISMVAVFVLAYALLWLIGMPYALLLAIVAGLLEFVPILGPAIAGVIIVLGGLAHGPEMALWAFVAYVVMQAVESNVLQPIVQEQVVRLPAAFNLSFQLVMGALFGILGIALAVPIAAAGKVWLDELYVGDALGGPSRQAR